ncbi:atp-nad kinase [Lichtheimia corymbifera JMRC:FSU:9682]|uniref:Atp-nad kinase n=1 Tax=Lichtheimia corymbifera JMRC:FSU:9682 TaxID=1263082 RepID=A0A068RQC1_9FUNG|nr:atp-nad kinase [Lichtheimia corymbifera JMRC:FSU:9682]
MLRSIRPCCFQQTIRRFYSAIHAKTTLELPDKVPFQLTREQWALDDNRQVHSMFDLIKTRETSSILQVPGSTYGGKFTLDWTEQKPRNVLIIKKLNDVKTEKALLDVANWLHQEHPEFNLIVEPGVAEHFKEQLPFVHVVPPDHKNEYTRTVDFAITLGGDGTLLHLASLFPKAAPPVVSFSLGTLGFLMSFRLKHFRRVLNDMTAGKMSLMLRMRLFCSLHQPDGRRISVEGKEVGDRQVMNEVTLHRGRFPHLTSLGCFVDGEYLTECVADGLIVSTPTGSTAYSLSAGGPIVHPSVQSLVMTPICPRSLSFRTVLLPPSANIRLEVGDASRSQVEVSMDGQEVFLLDKGANVQISYSMCHSCQ